MDSKLEKNEDDTQRKGWTPLLALVCFATTLGTAIPVGYCLGVMNTPAEYIKSWCLDAFAIRYNEQLNSSQVDLLWSAIVSIFLIGGIFGSFIAGGFCNRFGRKGSLLVSAFLLTLSGILLHFCRMTNSVEMLLIGRFTIGVAAAITYTVHPIYLLEISPTHLRGSAAVFTSIGVTGGIFVGQIFSLQQVFGTEDLWEFALSFYTVFVVVSFLPVYWYPESPRWLYLMRQDEPAARKELERLRGKNSDECVNTEIADMKELVAYASNEKIGFLAVVKNPEYLLPLVICCSFPLCQQLSGINAIFFYSVRIFMKGGFSLKIATWMNFGAGFLNLVFASVSPILVQKFGRRPLMMFSAGGCGISLFGMAFALNYIDRVSWLPILCIAFIASFIFSFNVGLAPVPYFVGAELFEVESRSVAMSMGNFFSWSGNFMIGMFFPMLEAIWGSYAFLPCAAMCLYCFLLTWRYLPETRGKDVADVKPIMAKGFRSKVH
ncbi:PREDICTED: solute carrier family 2, facilitated glucose transporter member 1-like isoform X1 [Bactrocera latifrons]|uniref:Solute carrier family 2, facilitated glucose transporter member 3 n=2 Tax=Bactrocera latifrons TaxID=174628 RepID=A0A0K8V291_BACLA|nr:PREDICTED: solute carrier family 2, facilitated glucose transporter member 1-like isoform X1 [Bactrocera latifrons]